MISLNIKVKPGSFKDEISFDATGLPEVKIKERPVDGAANAYLIKFLAKEFKVAKSSIVLEKGATSRFKKILLDMDQKEFELIINNKKKI